MRRDSGFTLLELLIAIAVLGMLLMLLSQGVAFGRRMTALLERRQERSADLPAVDAALRRLLASADPGIYPEPAPFEGRPDSLSLLTTAPGSDGSYQPADASVFVAGSRLHMRWSWHRHVDWFGAPPRSQDLVLLEGVRSLVVQYLDAATGDWRHVWQKDALPELVRLDLTFDHDERRWPPLVIALRREALER